MLRLDFSAFCMALFALLGAPFILIMACLTIEMKCEYESVHLALFFAGVVADNTFLYGIPFLPDIFPALVIMVAFIAFNTVIFHMDQMGKLHRLKKLSFVPITVNHNIFRDILSREGSGRNKNKA